jgi:hypothetical protein
MDLDDYFGIRVFLIKNAGCWRVTNERGYGLENYTFFGPEGSENLLSWVVTDDEGYAEYVERKLRVAESEQKQYPHMRSMMSRNFLYF